MDNNCNVHWFAQDGDAVTAKQTLCEIRGDARAMLTAERCALNFLQTLSATATQTRHYVEVVCGTHAKIMDTRKTLPGLRMAQKYAVKTGGGHNQRIGLFDGVLIKENHILAAGGIRPALEKAFRLTPEHISVQIEVENLEQLREALDAGIPNGSYVTDDTQLINFKRRLEILYPDQHSFAHHKDKAHYFSKLILNHG